MPRTARQPRPRPRAAPADAPRPPRSFAWLASLALAISAAVVIARLLMLETVRNALRVTPGSPAIPVGPGPASGLVLDLLACVPALLVLARRWLDPAFTLRPNPSHLPMALLGAWAILSPLWAGDKFAALVSSCHLLAALVMLWSTSQLAHGWLHVRLLSGLCFGLLLVLIAHGALQRVIEQPALEQEWAQNKEEILRQRGFVAGSFEAGQFENKVLHGELMGFSASPNTHAAVLVLLIAASMGALVPRLRRRRAPVDHGFPGAGPFAHAPAPQPQPRSEVAANPAAEPSALENAPARPVVTAVIAVGIALGAYTITLTQSRTAYVTLLLAVLMFGAIALSRPMLARHAGKLYWVAVLLIALGTAALIGHGVHHGTLFHDSLNFRWRYWVGAFAVFRQHPLLGVGWDNFAPHYLAVRLPTATEEIRDPHNFLVRFFVELGCVGGVLAVAWMLRLWWEMTRPRFPANARTSPTSTTGNSSATGREPRDADASPEPRAAVGLAAIVVTAAVGLLINAWASIDFMQDAGFIIIELFRRAAFLLALLFGWAIVCLRHGGADGALAPDHRPAPWMLCGLLVGLALFLLHNAIDFALFEPGPLFTFALLAGTVLGVRSGTSTPAANVAPAPARARRRLALAGLCVGAAAWLIVAAAVALPIGAAEARAQDADRAMSNGQAMSAANLLSEARSIVPSNGDYAFRAAEAFRAARRPDRAMESLDAAVAASPYLAGYRAYRAELELERPTPDLGHARKLYENAVALDPNNVSLRIHFGDALAGKLELPREAADQLERALWYNDQLTLVEKKRLPAAQVDELRKRIAALRADQSAR